MTRLERGVFAMAGTGSAVMLSGIIWPARFHWLFAVGVTISFVGLGIIVAQAYKFVNTRFVPVYEELMLLCKSRRVDCPFNLRKPRVLIRTGLIALFLSAVFLIAGHTLSVKYDSFNWISLICEIAFLVTALVVPKLLVTVQDQADAVVAELNGKPFAKSDIGPPKSAHFILLLVPLRYREHLAGDLEEEYTTIVLPRYGSRAARAWYWWQVLSSIAPLLWSEVKHLIGLVVAWRSIQ